MDSIDNHADLILKINAQPSIPVGYANTYRCQILEVKKGTLEMGSFLMTILANDKKNLDLLSTKPFPDEFEIGFTKKDENVEKNPTSISGFVDDDASSWEIAYIK